MKVIKATIKRKNSYPRKTICENCESEIEYDKDDLTEGFNGVMSIKCPVCNEEIYLWNNENNVALNSDNIKFPQNFYHTSIETGAIDNCNDRVIRNEVKKLIELIGDKDGIAYSECGTLHISVARCSENKVYQIVVSKDYYSLEIPMRYKE